MGGSAINLDNVVYVNINNIMINKKTAGISIFKADSPIGPSKINVTGNLIVIAHGSWLMAHGSKWIVNINTLVVKTFSIITL